MRLLIAYFSWSGHTERIAKMLAVKTRGRLFRIERNPPYSTDTRHVPKSKARLTQKRSCGLP